ncbi:hypothetical protein KPL71_017068 [Citrus sinensis]|uniref:Uncharacterized protein n=1 Tax=Citrus sinensis TaxID=2711 RepID=A0ACB8KZC3_CITSI|nr:hypothetical protein KPL71_017068 [Citrus sinensis]
MSLVVAEVVSNLTKRKAVKKAQAKDYGFEEDKSDSEDEDEGIRKAGGDISRQDALAEIASIAAASKASASMPTPIGAAHSWPIGTWSSTSCLCYQAACAAISLQHNLAKIQSDAMPEHYEAELEITDFLQNARWKVTHKETQGPILEWTGAAITTRGQYIPT